MVNELGQALEDAEKDPDVRVVVITAKGRAFCVGFDLKMAAGPELATIHAQQDWCKYCNQVVLERIENMGKPVIASINGFAFAGGFEIMLAADLVIAANTTIVNAHLLAKNLTLNAGVTLMASGVIIADTIAVNGVITSSGLASTCKNLNITEAQGGSPLFLGGGGGMASSTWGYQGPSGYGAGGTIVNPNTTKPYFTKSLLKTHLANTISGGQGGFDSSNILAARGGGPLLFIAKTLILAATGSILSNGTLWNNYPGGAGAIGILANYITLTAGGQIAANGGNAGSDNIGSGGGTIVALARKSLADAATKSVTGGTGSVSNGEAGSILSAAWDFLGSL